MDKLFLHAPRRTPMPRCLQVFLLPTLAEPEQFVGRAVVVIDVLRATTTIVHALAAGAKEVIPCLEVDEARTLAAQSTSPALLGGERGGKLIAGFNFGNSPLEYTPATIGGKTLVFTTTNGTRAMLRCRQARRVLLGAFVNFSALCHELAEEEQVAIVCAGTDGDVTREDTLLAGAIVDELSQLAPTAAALNDQAEIAADAWRAACRDLTQAPLASTLRHSRGGRNLIEIGQENDIAIAAEIDKFDIVPQLDLKTWHIRIP